MSKRRFPGVVAGLALAAALSMGVSGAEPSDLFGDPRTSFPPVAEPWSPEMDVTYHPDDVAALAKYEEITLKEAELRMRLETAALALQPMVAERWPDTFGGMWLQKDGPPGLVVAFTEDAEANGRTLRSTFEFPELVRTDTVERSMADLEAQLSRMVEERDQIGVGRRPSGIADPIYGTGGEYTLGIRPSENAVMVYTPEASSELLDAFKEAYGSGVVVVGRDIQPLACSRTDCRYELRGGLKVQVTTSPNDYCSSAFAARSPNNYYLLSAGHCPYTDRWHAGEWFGYVTSSVESGHADVERIYRPWPSQWYVGASIFVESGDIRPIYSYITWASTMENTWIGKAGARTGVTRGYISDTNVSVSWIAGSSRFILADFCARPGDSGGSVFRGETAYGIVVGGQESICNSNSIMVYGNIDYSLSAVNLQLLTSP